MDARGSGSGSGSMPELDFKLDLLTSTDDALRHPVRPAPPSIDRARLCPPFDPPPSTTPTHRAPSAAMPTPESEAFLAKKPKVPNSFDGVNYDDNAALKAAQDAILREQWVKSMMARLVRDELGNCYRKEGVNHLENCTRLRERYLELLQESKVRGYLFQQQNYIPKTE